MYQSPHARNRRQKILEEMESQLGPDVEQLRLLGHWELALLQHVVEKEHVSTAGLASALMLEPGKVVPLVERLKTAGLLDERWIEPCAIVEPTPKCQRLKRAIASME